MINEAYVEITKHKDGNELRSQFNSRFMQLIYESDFEFGFNTVADEYVRQVMKTYEMFVREWINDLYIKNFNDSFVTCAILRVISHFEYRQLFPQGMTMAAASITHADVSVRECGVRCFENWEHPDGLKILQNLSFSEDWLDDYLKRVISDLREIFKKKR